MKESEKTEYMRKTAEKERHTLTYRQAHKKGADKEAKTLNFVFRKFNSLVRPI